ncbi:3-deoxy-D-arabino-heptulosonate 7-phosphate synthase [Pollutimonas sp. H1-120]|uniref:3-deoxy-D-arabino-heptulosonate 7-phosphate synthase n=1 Tax=Pollutimonas sp. H1-120 TaxID=3148824 RepID=UPI003B526508
MSMPPSLPFLDQTLRAVARRYRLPAMDDRSDQIKKANPSAAIAMVIEKAREAKVRGETPDPELKRVFIEALARMIREAMRPESGDPAFQAMVLRHGAAQVREYASLSAHADQDRRLIHTVVDAIAHPAKQQRLALGRQRDSLANVHALASAASWSELFDTTRTLLAMPEIADGSPLERGLTKLLDSPALKRLRRLETLASDELVRRYQSLWDRHGPRSGSPAAFAQGSVSKQRGAAVEALAARAIQALARRLNEKEGSGAPYRAVTSMRVPASIPGSSHRAKTEWDVALLRRAQAMDARPVWEVCLLVEAKASVDAAASDLPRLLRGLRLLAQAEENAVYPFRTEEGTMQLLGSSLRALRHDEAGLAGTVLYCCDAPADAAPRLFGAASRMQLLSATASLKFADSLAEKHDANPQSLESIWRQLLDSPSWGAVLHQSAMLRQVRELMVHTDDLLDAVHRVSRGEPSSA